MNQSPETMKLISIAETVRGARRGRGRPGGGQGHQGGHRG